MFSHPMVALCHLIYDQIKKVNKNENLVHYRMRAGIKIKSVIIVPDNRLHEKREWAEVTLMGYGCNKL